MKDLPPFVYQLSLSDIRPIYLGWEKDKDIYYFYIIKDNQPRFLVYSGYFYLGFPPKGVLSLKPPPEHLELDLLEYLQEKFHYTFKKIRKNSRNETPVKQYAWKEDLLSQLRVMGSTVKEKHSPDEETSPNPVKEKRRRISRDPGLRVSEPISGNAGVDSLRLRSPRKKSSVSAIPEYVPVIEVKPVVQVPSEAPKRGRGRPRKIQPT